MCNLFSSAWENGILKKLTHDFEIDVSGKGYYNHIGLQFAHGRVCLVWGVVRGVSRVVSVYSPPRDRTGYEIRRGWRKLDAHAKRYASGARIVGNDASGFISVGEWDCDGIRIREYDKDSDDLLKSECYQETRVLLKTVSVVLKRYPG